MKVDRQILIKQKLFHLRADVMEKILLRATGGRAMSIAKEKRRELLVRAVPQFLHGGVF
jgi:hypothetical protein